MISKVTLTMNFFRLLFTSKYDRNIMGRKSRKSKKKTTSVQPTDTTNTSDSSMLSNVDVKRIEIGVAKNFFTMWRTAFKKAFNESLDSDEVDPSARNDLLARMRKNKVFDEFMSRWPFIATYFTRGLFEVKAFSKAIDTRFAIVAKSQKGESTIDETNEAQMLMKANYYADAVYIRACRNRSVGIDYRNRIRDDILKWIREEDDRLKNAVKNTEETSKRLDKEVVERDIKETRRLLREGKITTEQRENISRVVAEATAKWVKVNPMNKETVDNAETEDFELV